jgi:hypothetical protein
MRKRKSNSSFFGWAGLVPVLFATICCLVYFSSFTDTGHTAESETNSQVQSQIEAAKSQLTPETLELIKDSERRSYENKMMARELLRYVKVMTIILAVTAVGFPLAMWLLSRKRLLGLSGLSGEVAATLLVVEERQAKLANILKDLQGEIDYLHTMSVPDLKNLIQQAEKYLKQNEQDLEKAGLAKEKK